MMKLPPPQYSFSQILAACESGISNEAELQDRLNIEREEFNRIASTYEPLGRSNQLVTIRPFSITPGQPNNIIGSLTRENLTRLYSYYLVNESKPGRIIYDNIKNSARENCPFCGGIGTPHTVDHYLPKSSFPQFSIHPYNLIPSCRDCNSGAKLSKYATTASEQYLHPYFDAERFFSEQWICATYHPVNGGCGYFTYAVLPPDTWNEEDKSRVNNYFDEFGIALKYAKQSAGEIADLFPTITRLRSVGITDQVIIETVLQPKLVNNFPNHWKVPLYQALIHWLS